MSFVPKLLATTASVALGLTAIAAPAAAVVLPPERTTATVTVVQGIPGNVDICVGGKEVASDVAFGKWASRTVETLRVYKVRVFRPDPRACAGTKLISRKVDLTAGRDVSLVLKLGSPRVVMFENPPLRIAADVPELPADFAFVSLRHAARARDVAMNLGYSFPVPPLLAGEPLPVEYGWNAGDEQWLEMPAMLDVLVAAKRLSSGERLLKTKAINLSGGKYHEVYLVGWNKASYRWVVVRRPLEDVFGEIRPI